jgi:6-phosphogluconolactonase
MTERSTDYGRLLIGSRQELFAKAVELAVAQHARARGGPFLWALSGGRTPQDWYHWCIETGAIPAAVHESAHFTVSDERHVPLDSPQSNFGNAERLLLTPLFVPAEHRHPWTVACPPPVCAKEYAEAISRVAGAGRAYDVCMLGMGEDAHTASFFPRSPLLIGNESALFAAVMDEEKGWRLTITPAGLCACGLILVMTFGSGKNAALKRVFTANYDPIALPAQVLKTCHERVVWLVDDEAAAGL